MHPIAAKQENLIDKQSISYHLDEATELKCMTEKSKIIDNSTSSLKNAEDAHGKEFTAGASDAETYLSY